MGNDKWLAISFVVCLILGVVGCMFGVNYCGSSVKRSVDKQLQSVCKKHNSANIDLHFKIHIQDQEHTYMQGNLYTEGEQEVTMTYTAYKVFVSVYRHGKPES